MRILRSIHQITDANRGASAAIGNFDGVHLGHQSVLDVARRAGAPLGVLTFEPHPREFFAPDAPPFRLMNAAARAHRLEKLGVHVLFELPFTQDIIDLTPVGFVADVLDAGLGLSHVVVGADFCFGKGRLGTADDLDHLCRAAGIDVTIAPLLATETGEVSSTRIRRALSDGQPEVAAEMLGHVHRIEGPVLHGEKRGRTLGYPTANMSIAGLHPPKFGVYAVRVEVLDGPHRGGYDGVASLGVRPMFDGDMPNLESFLFDFSGDLYGANISVGLVKFLRPEATFDGLPALIAQMDADSAAARAALA
jgi:riboflavin kinase / FMN adenylyltransferase